MLRSRSVGSTHRISLFPVLKLVLCLCVVCMVAVSTPVLLHAQNGEDEDLDRFYEQAFGVPAEPMQRNIHITIHGRAHGEIRAFVTPAGRLISLHEQRLKSVLEEALREDAFPDVAAGISESEDPENGDDAYVEAAALEPLNIGVHYERQSRTVNLSVPGTMLRTRTLSVRERSIGPGLPESAPRVDVAPVSGGLGVSAGYRISDIGAERENEEYSGSTPGIRQTAELTGTPFVSARDWTLDSELDWRFRSAADDPEQQFRVSQVRVRRLWEQPGILLTLGDLSPDRDVFQSRRALQGISISRRGTRRAQSSDPLSQFSLDSASDIEVVLNDEVVFERTLPPGSYELSDIPVSQGLNEVLVRFPETDREDINLWLPHDAGLLKAGEQEFFHGFGLPAVLLDPDRPVEGETLRTTSRHRYGFTPDVTGSVGAQLSPEAGQISGGVQAATAVGNLGAATAFSFSEDREIGFGLQSTYGLFLNAVSFRPSLRISAGWFGPTLADPDRTTGRGGMPLQASAAYAQSLPFSMTGSLRSEVRHDPVTADTDYRASLSLSSSRIPNTRVSGRIEYRGGDDQGIDGLSGFIGVRVSPVPRVSGSYRQSVTSPDASVAVSARGSTEGVGRYQGSVNADYNMADPGRVERLGAQTSLSGQRGSIGLSGSVSTTEDRGSIGSLRASARSGLVFAGNVLALEPPPAEGSFAIVRIDPESELDEVAMSGGGRSTTVVRSGLLGSVIVPGLDAYEPVPVRFSRAGLPLGYEIVPSLLGAQTGLRTGTVIEPQLRGIVFARGTLKDGDGEPVTLTALTLERVDEEEPADGPAATAPTEELLFTNRDGQFEARGLRAGTYELGVPALDDSRARFTIPEERAGRYDLGTVRFETGSETEREAQE